MTEYEMLDVILRRYADMAEHASFYFAARERL